MLSSSPYSFRKYNRDLNQRPAIPSSVRLKNKWADSQTNSANLFLKYFHSTFNTPLPSFVNSGQIMVKLIIFPLLIIVTFF